MNVDMAHADEKIVTARRRLNLKSLAVAVEQAFQDLRPNTHKFISFNLPVVITVSSLPLKSALPSPPQLRISQKLLAPELPSQTFPCISQLTRLHPC